MKLISISFLLVLLCNLVACGAGSGEGLNEQGLPPVNKPNTPSNDGVTLAQLNANIFGAICINCHVGANAPRGLRLDSEENAYAFLVSRPSDERPDLFRVNPGKPDDSYIVKKIEGAPDIVGGRMPLGGPYLSQNQIDAIRTWIANGAPRTGTGTATTKVIRADITQEKATQEKLSVNLNSSELSDDVTVQLHFSRAIDTDSFDMIDRQTLSVFYHTQDERKQTSSYATLLTEKSLYISVGRLPKTVEKIEVIIHNTELHPLLDEEHRVFDGNSDEQEGGSYTYVFTL
jgi:hypothetical protein